MDPCAGKTTPSIQVRVALATFWGLLCLWVLAAPMLRAYSHPAAAAAVYYSFSFFCHQIPARSFEFLHYPLAVCHRCIGIYGGLFFGSILAISYNHISWRKRRFMLAAAIAPLLLDATLPIMGLWTNTWWSRSCTGFILGYLTSPLLLQGVYELYFASLRRSFASDIVSVKGDYS
jgi:uncharacterized membrane protein